MFSNFKELKWEVVSQGDVLTVSMASLRDLVGKDRLGRNVAQSISRSLAREGLMHYPKPLPHYQEEFARIYTKESPIDDIIQAVITPGAGHDTILRQAVAAGDDADKLDQIRQLLC